MKVTLKYCLLIAQILIVMFAFNIQSSPSLIKNDYPIRFAYIDDIQTFDPPEEILRGMGVPGYSTPNIYNYVSIGFWTYKLGSQDISGIWSDPVKYFGTSSALGTTKDEIQIKIKKLYNDKGIKLLISAFGGDEYPTTLKINPINCATKLAFFIDSNNVDGVDIKWNDTDALRAGTGQQWLIDFTTELRVQLPNHIITHSPLASYFQKENFKNGGYMKVDQAVGALINFYNVIFYNLNQCRYDSYGTLLMKSVVQCNGTSVIELSRRGIPKNKIVIGKPVQETDSDNTGWISLYILGEFISQAYNEQQYFGGVALWQFRSDSAGQGIQSAAGHLKQLCAISKSCH